MPQSEFPTAILHLDGDAFFTSIEQAVHPELRGRKVVTGKERGIIACASYEAKAAGIKRGVALHEAIKAAPDLVVLPSDYETYSLYSKRMFSIMRRFAPVVEESSIDEGFADLTSLERICRGDFIGVAQRLKKEIQAELDITVSVGLSLSKGLAKLASKYRKPDGFTAVGKTAIPSFLKSHELDDVWGFAENRTALLGKYGVKTAYDYSVQHEKLVKALLGKIGWEIWNELRGISIYKVTPETKTTYQTISKCKTFTAPSTDRDYILAKLIRNVESSFIKLRRHRLKTRLLAVALRKNDFREYTIEANLNRHTSATHEVLPLVHEMFDRLYQPGIPYRTTVIFLADIVSDASEQFEFFQDRLRIDHMRQVSAVIDEVNQRYGKHKLSLGTSLYLPRHRMTERDEEPLRKADLLKGETRRRRLKIPKLGIRV